MRIRIDLAYDGGAFHGWAIQPGLRTVQASFEDALATALRLSHVRVVCAGRTDTGVHARGQVVHLDVDESVVGRSAGRSQDPPLDALRRRLNGILDADVRVRRVVAAPDGFDARFSALWRRYSYRLWDDPADVDPLRRSHVVAWDRPLDLDQLVEASTHLVGHRDFASFCRRRAGATTVRTLLELSWAREETGLIEATVVADAFCHSMVRSLIGCLLAVGDGRRPTSWSSEVQAGLSRHPAVTVAHAHGLTLEQVAYPEDADLGERAALTRATRTSPDGPGGPECSDG